MGIELLSERERTVYDGLVVGKLVSAIAKEQSLSQKTVSTYRHRLCKKLGIKAKGKSNAPILEYFAKQPVNG